jgi:BASS family bile acid:Na+ symporter
MTLASLIMLALRASIALTVLALGLDSSIADATYLFRRPKELLKALLSMNVVMPAVAILIAKAFDLHAAVKIALVALSVSPVPPILPRKASKASGHASYAMGLLVAAALFSIVFVPGVLELLQLVFGIELGVSPIPIIELVLMTVIGPLALGIAVRQYAPAFAARITKPVTLAGIALLVASALPIVFTSRVAIVSLIGNGTMVAFAAFIVAGLATGYLLGGPAFDHRTVLALASSSRHPGIALAIANANFPQQKLAAAAVALYLIVNLIIGIPYGRWSRHRRATLADVPDMHRSIREA